MTPQEVLNNIEDVANTQYLPIIGPQKGQVLVDLVKSLKPRQILEVGTLVGYSAILIAQYLPPTGKLICVEMNHVSASKARYNLTQAGLLSQVNIIIGDIFQVIKNIPGPINLLFIDAAKDEYLQYLCLIEPKLAAKAVVVADNVGVFSSQLSDYLDYVRHSGKYDSKTIDFAFDAVEVSTRNS